MFNDFDELPHSEEAELNLIGSTILDGAIPVAARDIKPGDFYNINYQAVWKACLEIDQDSRSIDPFSIYELMKWNEPALTKTFSMQDLYKTTNGLYHGASGERSFADAIRQNATKRYLIKRLYQSARAIASEPGLDAVQSLVKDVADLDIRANTRQGSFKLLRDVFDADVEPALEELHSGLRSSKIPIGFPVIDEILGGGLSTSDVLLIAGLPGSGKSALMLQTATNIAASGVPVAYVSGEMTDRENGFRMLSQASQITNLNSLQHIDANELSDLRAWSDNLKSLPIYLDSRSSDLQTIARSVRSLVENVGVKVVFLDYIQLFKLNRYESRIGRTERISEVSQEIKRIAMELGIGIVAVAQFNREGAKSGKPSMHDLEGASQLEKDASLIFIIDQERGSNAVELRIAKGRNVGTCMIPGTFTGRCLEFQF